MTPDDIDAKAREEAERLIPQRVSQDASDWGGGGAVSVDVGHLRPAVAARIAEYRRALAYYARESTYESVIIGIEMIAPIENDKGALARRVLAGKEEG